MSQYFRPRRAPSSLVESNDKTPAQERNALDVITDNHILSSSILIFPNAPSERESFSNAIDNQHDFSGSMSSLPTDMSVESFPSSNESKSHDRDVYNPREGWQKNPSPGLRSVRSWDDVFVEEEGDRAWDSGNVRPVYERLTSYSPRPHTVDNTRTSSSVGSPFACPLSLSPELPFRLPFISFFQNFITLDESTLHLISRSPDSTNTVLFSVSPGPPSRGEYVDEPTHGEIKLLLDNPDKAKNMVFLKAGIDPSEVPPDMNPILMGPTRIPVWEFFRFMIKGGVRVWKEVSWEGGDAKLIGV
ncbi:hypothetical protein K439DRAFT_1641349 [Ramaria rubella]|nr:hypothetical protein K439DRAFT_1641349 [Ramaria rubella]